MSVQCTGGNNLKAMKKGIPDRSQVKPMKLTERPDGKDRKEAGRASVEERQIVEIEHTFGHRWEW